MHSIFAVEPSSVNNWNDLRYVVEKFGISKGLLIAQYPKSWMRMVMEACKENEVGEVELKKIEEKLSQIKLDRMMRLGLPYDKGTWRENAASRELDGVFDGILVSDDMPREGWFCVSTVCEKVFENRNQRMVVRRAEDLAKAAEYLIASSERIFLVDRYFGPKRGNIKFLRELVKILLISRCPSTEIVVFSDSDRNSSTKDEDEKTYRGLLGDCIGRGVRFKFCRINVEKIDWDFHARYLFTAKGGIYYDRGFVEPERHDQREHETHVGCMGQSMYQEIYSRFCDEVDEIAFTDVIEIGE